jgi:tetratricopeptide (TPR) repeat protein
MINYEEIEQYLNGEMDHEAALLFEEKMQSNNDLAIEVELYQSIQLEGKQLQQIEAEKNELQQTLTQLNSQHFLKPTATTAPPSPTTTTVPIPNYSAEASNTKKGIFSIKRVVQLVAAAAAVFFVFLFIKNIGTTSTDPNKLFAQYALADELTTERGTTTDSLQLLSDSLFNTKNYTAAAPIIEQYLATNEQATDYKLALGYSYLQTNEFEKAQTIFSEIAQGTTLYTNKANWYMALLLLKQNNKEACAAQLKLIEESASNYKQAQALLKAITR